MFRFLRLLALLGGAVISQIVPAVAGGDVLARLGIELVEVPGGPFLMGSSAEEKEYGYLLDEAAYGHSRTREWRWYDREREITSIEVETFSITRNLITNQAYLAFIEATGYPLPSVDAATWASYGLIHPFPSAQRLMWREGTFPPGYGDHPVVLVSHGDAEAFAAWLSSVSGLTFRLPSEWEWEKAARGTQGAYFPWGNDWDPARLNSHDAGPFDTLPVGAFPSGASPYGLLDMAGQVYEWTATPEGAGRWRVKGGSWDDRGCGVCRAAAWHARPEELKHILIGFRLVATP